MSNEDKKFGVRWTPANTVTLDPRNARSHNERSLLEIEKSLLQFGQQKPIVVDIDRIVRAGNGTVQAIVNCCERVLLEMQSTDAQAANAARETWQVLVDKGFLTFDSQQPRVWANFTDLDKEKAIAYALADNRTAEHSEWEVKELEYALAQIQKAGYEAEDIGFAQAELEALLKNGIEQPDIPITPPEDLSGLFTDNDSQGKEKKVKIVLEYSEDEAQLVKAKLLEKASPVEKAVWELLGL